MTMSDRPDPEQPGGAAPESGPAPAVDADPIPLPGAGGPVGGPVAGEGLDALNQPLPPTSEPPASE